VAERVVSGVCVPIPVGGSQYEVGASIGVAVYPDDAQDVESLLRCADQAMYAAKQGGGNCVRRHAS
jgi:diguanylate cyclase (GGDEF)-like protein